MGRGCGTRFEFECYDSGHLYTLAHFLDRKLIEPPLFVQSIFGILGGTGGKLAKSNAEQVSLIRSVLELLSLETATPTEAREILKLKGSSNVRF